jgi:hypothetical protein
MNIVIEYLESSLPPSTPSPPEPNNTILKAINELQTGMKRLEENYCKGEGPVGGLPRATANWSRRCCGAQAQARTSAVEATEGRR